MRALFRGLLPESVAAGGVVDAPADGSAAALWLPPGVPAEFSPPPDARPEVAAAFAAIAENCPPQPFWYLAFLGAPEGGSGHGSAVISVGLERADADRVPSALWTGAERNLRFYGRHGFRVLTALEFGGGAGAWWMWRNPYGLDSQLAALRPVDERERESITRFRAELARLRRPFDEHADLTHVTASAIVVGPRGVLLHRHKLLGLWLQPGGHVEPGEAPAAAALREAGEETGLRLRLRDGVLFHVDVHAAARGHTHLDLRYVVEAGDEEPAPPPGESQEVRWFGFEEAVAIADAGLVGALRKLRA